MTDEPAFPNETAAKQHLEQRGIDPERSYHEWMRALHRVRDTDPPPRGNTFADHEPHEPRLSPRQTDILELYALGYTRPEIARRLGIAEETVKRHSALVRQRLEARTTPHAVYLALTRQIIHPEKRAA